MRGKAHRVSRPTYPFIRRHRAEIRHIFPLVHDQSEGEGDEEHRDDDDEGEKDDEEEDHDDDDDEHHDDEEDEDDHEDDHKHTWVEPGTSAEGVQQYTQPLRYPVKKTGYYCVGMSTLHSSLLPGLERAEI